MQHWDSGRPRKGCKIIKDVKQLTIDFLYLDLSVCDRCQAADKVLDEALSGMRGLLPSRVTVNKFQVSKDEVDESFRSPTIRINGRDIEEILNKEFNITEDQKDNECKPCSDVCEEDTLCRVYEYRGKEYTAIPKEMIQEAIAKTLGIELTIGQSESTASCCTDTVVEKSKATGCGCAPD